MKKYKYFLLILPAGILVIFVMLQIMSRSAAAIFNKVMQEQTVLQGEITVEKIRANVFGEVTFQNLLWKDPRGGTLLAVPEGGFKIKIFDALTRNFKTTTIEELTLKGANVSINFDENMHVDILRQSPDFKKVSQEMQTDSGEWEQKISRVNKTEDELKEIGERRRQLQRSKIEKGWQNFNLAGNKINLHLNLENCQFEIFYRERHYLLRNVKFETKINTDDEMTLKVRTGKFGGTMIGNGLSLSGNVNFKTEIPQCDLRISLKEVDPSSLGLGLNIHDTMTLTANFQGSISQPVGKGSVKMATLQIPGITFENVEGEIYYENATLEFNNVTAEAYKGTLAANGDYNIDTRYYNIYGNCKNLKASAALPGAHLHCNVDLELAINSKGNARETVTSGSFSSGRGRYSVIMFDSISGKFKTGYKEMYFYDVAINMGGYKIATDALSIVDKKLTWSPITISDSNGDVRRVYQFKI